MPRKPMIAGRGQVRILQHLAYGQDEWRCWLDQISLAERHLYITTFFVEPDEYGHMFVRALTAAALRGVRCIVIVDESGTRLANFHRHPDDNKALQVTWNEFRQAGGILILSRPANRIGSLLLTGNHIKFGIVDGARALVTGRNIGKWSFEAWNDYGVLMEGSMIERLMQTFLDLLQRYGEVSAYEKIQGARRIGPVCEGGFYADYHDFDPVWMGGYFRLKYPKQENGITQLLNQKISLAKKSVKLTSFLFKPVRILRRALANAAQRGVAIDIIASGRNALPEAPLAYRAASCGYGELLRAGVRIHEAKTPEHSKLICIDDDWAGFGSYNFECQAHDRLREMLISSDDESYVSAIGCALKEKLDPGNSDQVRENDSCKKTVADFVMRRVRWFL